jgi:HK97 family phage major capsid protein
MLVKDLIDKRAKVVADARALLDNAEKEGRDLTAEEQAKWDAFMREEEALRQQIERWTQLEQRSRYSPPSLTTPEGPSAGRGDEYRDAWLTYVRYGMSSLTQPQLRAMGEGTGSAGGYLVPQNVGQKIVELLQSENFVRQYATVITTSSTTVIPAETAIGSASWVAEGASLTDTAPTFGNPTLSAYALAALIKVSQELLQDSGFDLESYIASVVARQFAAAEEAAFVDGDGSGKPTGIFRSASTGVTAASATAIAADELISLYYSLSSPYRSRAIWIVHDTTAAAIRKLKDSSGQYLWQPGLSAGSPDTLLGRPLYTSSSAPTIGAGKKSVLFGDLSFYWIGDRAGRTLQRLNELFAANRQVGFLATERVDGVLTSSAAAKVLVHP